MVEKVLKAAVIGTGAISKEHLSFLAKSNLAHLVGVCDLSLASAKYAAQKFGADALYTDYHQMLEEAKPDVIHILTPPQSHKPIATDCLKAGIHVICEKPITLSYDDFKDLWSTAQAHNVYLIEDHNYRYNTPILAIEKLIKDDVLGEVQDVEVRMSLAIRDGGLYADENLPNPGHKLPAGIIHDFITHLSYLALRFMPEVEEVKAAWRNLGGGNLFKYDDLDAFLMAGSVHGRIRFSSYTKPDCFEVIVRGSKGYAQTDLYQPYLRCVIPRKGGKQLSPLINHFVNGWDLMNDSVRNFRRKIMQQTPYEGLHRLLEITYQSLIDGKEPPITFEDMARTSRLIEALLAQENQI
ncbi:oxidoreductase domain protein [Gloeothece citriformis PCC 7424]|uniref:Oxidoreductase domain protein n=1 Tax=Gloeothece citriformis (strain PCC 7424) TaxID=65393 RepID=B7KJF9_GLOC7|nr:Gfo/Idh/MocA family oxidoreductase [Gloeothece citriformis]ACK73636.1 oxidoreductase domain protein [Gloeothece citriformis PCC 7424]